MKTGLWIAMAVSAVFLLLIGFFAYFIVDTVNEMKKTGKKIDGLDFEQATQICQNKSSIDRDSCLMFAAIRAENSTVNEALSLCMQIEAKPLFDSCAMGVALTKYNSSVCAVFEDPDYRLACEATSERNLSKCDKFTSETDRQKCTVRVEKLIARP